MGSGDRRRSKSQQAPVLSQAAPRAYLLLFTAAKVGLSPVCTRVGGSGRLCDFSESHSKGIAR